MAAIVLNDVRRVQADGTAALDGLDLAVADGELLGIIGASGSGKSTLLRVIAGLEPVAQGRVLLDGQDVTHLPTRDRNLSLVAQQRTLYSFLTVAEQLAFPLELRRMDATEVHRRTDAERRAFRLGRIWGRRPSQLSAGDAQRTAIARAMVRLPAALLLDEPLQLLDTAEQARLRHELHRFQMGSALTTLFATNDHHQVLGIADRVAVLRGGRVVQVGPPQQLLRQPVDRFVAGFVGDPPMTVVAAEIGQQGGLGWLQLGRQRLRVPGGLPGPLRDRVGSTVLLGARPDVVREARPDDAADVRLLGRVRRVVRLGPADQVTVEVPTGEWVAGFSPGGRQRPGDQVEIVVEVRRLSVFDAVDGRAVWHGS